MADRKETRIYRKISHCGFKYYQENPSLTIWESIEEILKTCNLMP